MNSQESIVIHKLREYNKWRRGDEELPQPDPFEVGGYIDDICDIAERLEKELKEARNEIDGWKNKWNIAVEFAAIAENKLDDTLSKLQNALIDK